jgi:site-specific recombinase XerD
MLFKVLMDEYLKSIKDKSAYRDDESRYRNYLAERFDNKRLTDIQVLDLERLINELTKKKLAPATVAHALKLMRHAFNRAIAWGYFKGLNPVKQVKLPTFNNDRQRFLNFQEAEQLLAALQKVSQQTHDVALLSLHCGLRVGEIFNLKMQDIDLQNNLIRISDPKNKTPRSAYMTDAVKKMLLNYYSSKNPDEPVFKDKWHG